MLNCIDEKPQVGLLVGRFGVALVIGDEIGNQQPQLSLALVASCVNE